MLGSNHRERGSRKEGIGESTVRLLCHHGERVVVADIQDNKGKALYHKLGRPTFAIFIHYNVSGESNVCKAMDAATITAYGKLNVVSCSATPRS
ncbi:hypothetical protein Taro_056354 [Colocasia esculenta]|uniref:Uncharacterized protein n=1 Tax=Colocasia esculenta TaxID=4460 RepID=A0A843XW91_COLES|nr:hypothetical protein [Colocasia esculenta]